MGDERKLIDLKENFLKSLEIQSEHDCLDARLKAFRCLKNSWFQSCFKEQQEFYSCVKERLSELKKENKDLLDFEI